MTKEEAHDFIAIHYPNYINREVHFASSGITAKIKAIDVLEGDGGNYVATCFLENPKEDDPEFKNHIFSHLPLQQVIEEGQLL